MLKKLCKCGKVISQSQARCEACSTIYSNKKKLSNKIYNSKNRDKELDDFYKSNPWINTRHYILTKYYGMDLWDYFVNDIKGTIANTVHHIEEIKDSYDLRLDEKNLFPVSSKNHNKIHSLYKKDKKGTQKKLKEILALAESEFCEGV
ncbi:MAG: hypothetical protein ACRCW0_06750 [Clostridium sp.]